MLNLTIERFGYAKRRDQLRDVRLSVGPGRTVLLGPNGAGKTTLLKAVAGVHGFNGSLDIDGDPQSTRRRSKAYRSAVGWLPQNVTPLPALTAREHVAYLGWLKGLSTRTAAVRAADALAMVGLESKADERAERLSGGQMRRLGIAGVLVHDAAYLLLDEPTAGLDPRERDRLVNVLRDIERDRSVLVSTHDAGGLIDENSQVVVLAAGSVRFSGSRAAFIEEHPAASVDDQLRLAYAARVPED